MTTRKTRSTRKTSTAKTGTARSRTKSNATPSTEPTQEQTTEEISAKLDALLTNEAPVAAASEDAPATDSKEDTPSADEKPEETAPVEAPKAKKPKMLPGQIDPDKAGELGEDEFEVEVDRIKMVVGPHDKTRPLPEGVIVKRFTKPARWAVTAGARNARMWHVIDLDATDKRVLCTLVWDKWLDGRDDRDPETKAITCPFCLPRAIVCGITTEAKQQEIRDAEIKAKKDAQAAARKKKADALVAKAAALKAAEEAKSKAKAAEEAAKASGEAA